MECYGKRDPHSVMEKVSYIGVMDRCRGKGVVETVSWVVVMEGETSAASWIDAMQTCHGKTSWISIMNRCRGKHM